MGGILLAFSKSYLPTERKTNALNSLISPPHERGQIHLSIVTLLLGIKIDCLQRIGRNKTFTGCMPILSPKSMFYDMWSITWCHFYHNF